MKPLKADTIVSKTWLKKFFKIPLQERKGISLDPRLRVLLSQKNKERCEEQGRIYYTKDEIIALARKYCLYTFSDFQKLKKRLGGAEKIPSILTLYKYFKSASNFRYEVWGIVEDDEKTKREKKIRKAIEIAQLCLDLKIDTYGKYMRAHKLEPHIFPSLKFIYKMFGRWENFKRCMQAVSIKSIFERYYFFKQKLGRWPTDKECREEGIEIKLLLTYFDNNREKLKDLVVSIEKSFNNRKK